MFPAINGSGINWTSVKNSGISFAWAKATEGTSITDADFAVNENNGKAAGVYMGAYHFAHPESDSPGTESSHFWSVAGGYIKADGKTYMPMLDMEVFSGLVGASSLLRLGQSVQQHHRGQCPRGGRQCHSLHLCQLLQCLRV